MVGAGEAMWVSARNPSEGGSGSQGCCTQDTTTLASVACMVSCSDQRGWGPAKRARPDVPSRRQEGPDPAREVKEVYSHLLLMATRTSGDRLCSWESRLPGFVGLPASDRHVSHRERPGSRPQL